MGVTCNTYREIRNTYKILFGIPENNGDARRQKKNNINICLKGTGWEPDSSDSG
jgi:hypothetical protein